MAPPRIVLDCDTANEVDDQFAIADALGAGAETFEVRGVVSVHNTTAHGAPLAQWIPASAGMTFAGGLLRSQPGRDPVHTDPVSPQRPVA